MTKQDVIDYVMHSPYNTNRAVLTSLLDSIDSGGDMPEDLLMAVIPSTYIDNFVDELIISPNAIPEHLTPICLFTTYIEEEPINIIADISSEQGGIVITNQNISWVDGIEFGGDEEEPLLTIHFSEWPPSETTPAPEDTWRKYDYNKTVAISSYTNIDLDLNNGYFVTQAFRPYTSNEYCTLEFISGMSCSFTNDSWMNITHVIDNETDEIVTEDQFLSNWDYETMQNKQYKFVLYNSYIDPSSYGNARMNIYGAGKEIMV